MHFIWWTPHSSLERSISDTCHAYTWNQFDQSFSHKRVLSLTKILNRQRFVGITAEVKLIISHVGSVQKLSDDSIHASLTANKCGISSDEMPTYPNYADILGMYRTRLHQHCSYYNLFIMTNGFNFVLRRGGNHECHHHMLLSQG